jgi:hypothetical protein
VPSIVTEFETLNLSKHITGFLEWKIIPLHCNTESKTANIPSSSGISTYTSSVQVAFRPAHLNPCGP